MCDIRYFKSAYGNYKTAEILLLQADNDEYIVNNIAYNLQQCVEKTLKAFLECKGVTVPNTHNVEKLVDMSVNKGSSAIITDWLMDFAGGLTAWEAETRYNVDFFVEINRIRRVIVKVKEFLDINGMTYSLRKELENEEVKKLLLSYLPLNKQECDDFELNCFYQIYSKKIKRDLTEHNLQ